MGRERSACCRVPCFFRCPKAPRTWITNQPCADRAPNEEEEEKAVGEGTVAEETVVECKITDARATAMS